MTTAIQNLCLAMQTYEKFVFKYEFWKYLQVISNLPWKFENRYEERDFSEEREEERLLCVYTQFSGNKLKCQKV